MLIRTLCVFVSNFVFSTKESLGAGVVRRRLFEDPPRPRPIQGTASYSAYLQRIVHISACTNLYIVFIQRHAVCPVKKRLCTESKTLCEVDEENGW